MRCSKYGTDNREGRKFCAECGETLASKCPLCGATNEPGGKFCGECGAALRTSQSAPARKSSEPQIRIAETSPPENLEGERKTVSALFADIKGSMELIEDLDPEEARAIVDPARGDDGGSAALRGYVTQSTGDGILALFGEDELMNPKRWWPPLTLMLAAPGCTSNNVALRQKCSGGDQTACERTSARTGSLAASDNAQYGSGAI